MIADREEALQRAWDDLPPALQAHPGVKALRAALAAAPAAQPQQAVEQEPATMRVVMVGACQQCGHEHEFPDRAIAWVALGHKGSQVPAQSTTDEPTAIRWSKAGGDVVPAYAATHPQPAAQALKGE